MINQKFGKLTVISEAGKASNGVMRYNCVCDCGGDAVVRKGRLLSGETETCGCKAIIDINGMRFGMLAASGRKGADRWGQVTWTCVCDCGGSIVLDGARLRNGLMDHCGCQTSSRLTKAKTTHGMYGTPEYHSWFSLKSRCNDIDDDRYGGRGIGYDSSWETFERFYADMGEKPTLKHEIDRIDNNKGYSRENCKWSTRVENTTNTRRSRIWIVFGIVYQTMVDAVSGSGLSRWQIQDRCHRCLDGCSTELKYPKGYG